MFGLNLFYIEERMLEEYMRQIYRCISFKFDEGMRLRDYECVEEAFTEEEFNEVLKQNTIDANTTGQASHGGKLGEEKKEDIFSGLMMNMAAEDQYAE